MLSSYEPRNHDGSHLTAAQVAYLEKYMRKILRRLELNYWRIFIARDLPPERAKLMVEPVDGRRITPLYVADDWWDTTFDHRLDLTHEALHLAHHDQEEVIRRFKNDNGDVGSYPMSIVWDQFKIETERMVDSLSYVLAPHMPRWNPPKATREAK